jgi:hypothetical protein
MKVGKLVYILARMELQQFLYTRRVYKKYSKPWVVENTVDVAWKRK